MTKMKLLTIAVIGLLLLNVVFVGMQFFKKPPTPSLPLPVQGGGGPKQLIIAQLHLDSAQINAYNKLADAHHSSISALENQFRELKNNLYATLITNDTIAKKSFETQIAQVQKQIEEIHYAHFTEIKKLCHPNQLEAFNELTKSMARFFDPRNAGRPGGQRPPPGPRGNFDHLPKDGELPPPPKDN